MKWNWQQPDWPRFRWSAKHLAKAEEHLDYLDDLCTFGCEEYSELKELVAEYKAERQS